MIRKVGSSATLGTTTSFSGDIPCQRHHALNTGARITYGAAWAQTPVQVTLDTNTISLPVVAGVGVGAARRSRPAPRTYRLPADRVAATIPQPITGQRARWRGAIEASPQQGRHAAARVSQTSSTCRNRICQATLTQLAAGQGWDRRCPGGDQGDELVPVTGDQAVRRTKSQLLPQNPLRTASRAGLRGAEYKALNQAVVDPRRWSIRVATLRWRQTTITGIALAGSLGLRRQRGYGYRHWPRLPRHALHRWSTRSAVEHQYHYGLPNGLGGGRADMFQAAVYSLALRRCGLPVGRARLMVSGVDRPVCDRGRCRPPHRRFRRQQFRRPDRGRLSFRHSGRSRPARLIRRHPLRGTADRRAFRTPSYSERAVSGSSDFALAYDAQTTDTARTELGAWLDWNIPVDYGTTLSLRARAAWAHDYWSDPRFDAPMFVALAGARRFVGTSADAGPRSVARLGRRGDQFRGQDLARRQVRRRGEPAHASLYRHRCGCVIVGKTGGAMRSSLRRGDVTPARGTAAHRNAGAATFWATRSRS